METTIQKTSTEKGSKLICIDKSLLFDAVQTAQAAIDFILENASGEDFEKHYKVQKLLDQMGKIQLELTIQDLYPLAPEIPILHKTLFDW